MVRCHLSFRTIHLHGMDTLLYTRILFLIAPTGAYCREDRCQSFFDPKLIPTMRPPMEECESAGAVTSLGGVACVIDAPASRLEHKEVLDRVKSFSPDLIVLSTTFGTLEADLAWADSLKQLYPDTLIGLRGAPCYVWTERLLQRASVTFCLKGDYELAIKSLLLNGLGAKEGVSWRASDGRIINNPSSVAASLDDLPLPDRSSINQSLYRARFLGASQATVRVQRGCPFPCTYCLVHTVSGSSARHRSPEHIVREIRSLMAQGVRYFYLRADTFSLNKSWALSLCEALIKDCPGIRWVTTTRAECIDGELLKAFKKSGCYGLSFGIDVASAAISKKVRKPFSPKRAYEAMRLCDEHGILSLAYVMLGFIWDTPDTLKESAEFIRYIRPDLLTIHFAHPYPGTPYYDEVATAGLEVISNKAQAEPAVHIEGMLEESIMLFAKRTLVRHYSNPSVIGSLAKKFLPLWLRTSLNRLNYLLPTESFDLASPVEDLP